MKRKSHNVTFALMYPITHSFLRQTDGATNAKPEGLRQITGGITVRDQMVDLSAKTKTAGGEAA